MVEYDSNVSDDNKVANIFNEYLSNLVEDLNHHVPENLVNLYCKINLLNKFSFKTEFVSDNKKELQSLDISKVTQKSNIPTKIIKENFDILAPFLFVSVNSSIDLSKFQKIYNLRISHQHIKRILETTKEIIAQLVFYQIYLNFLKTSFMNKYRNFLIKSRNIKQVLKKDLKHKLAYSPCLKNFKNDLMVEANTQL